jgi:hypothetical protein
MGQHQITKIPMADWDEVTIHYRRKKVFRLELSTTQDDVVTEVRINDEGTGWFRLVTTQPGRDTYIVDQGRHLPSLIKASCLGEDCIGPIWTAFRLDVRYGDEIWNHIGLPNIYWVQKTTEEDIREEADRRADIEAHRRLDADCRLRLK